PGERRSPCSGVVGRRGRRKPSEAVTHIDFYDRLAELALGWLGWSEDQAMRADVNSILIGYVGKMEMLKAISGTAEYQPGGDEVKTIEREMTVELFDAVFG